MLTRGTHIDGKGTDVCAQFRRDTRRQDTINRTPQGNGGADRDAESDGLSIDFDGVTARLVDFVEEADLGEGVVALLRKVVIAQVQFGAVAAVSVIVLAIRLDPTIEERGVAHVRSAEHLIFGSQRQQGGGKNDQ